jgi:hypothetical protein
MRTISAVITAALILGSTSIASAAKAHFAPQYSGRNSVMLLEDGALRGPGVGLNAYAEEHNYIEKQNVWK